MTDPDPQIEVWRGGWAAAEDAVYAARDGGVTTIITMDGEPLAKIAPVLPDLELAPSEAQRLSILLAADIRADRERGVHGPADRGLAIWRKLQPLCLWDDPPSPP